MVKKKENGKVGYIGRKQQEVPFHPFYFYFFLTETDTGSSKAEPEPFS